MQPKGRNSRSEVFYISKSFRKAVTLPPARAWRVKDTDVAARGYVLCITKSKVQLEDVMDLPRTVDKQADFRDCSSTR
ncbi:hypothetical protein TELCIR_10287 [Teladorsagia circumcincta]|uniref:DUF7778 domain-containing protein n=1 Tax=Teladorsagia circumcincta TaxID=45464 RepID=A0A2G9UCH9_TELCI|nr:hypothetical protein TELCIR_10287 [Teladorsagia circumcincta]